MGLLNIHTVEDKEYPKSFLYKLGPKNNIDNWQVSLKPRSGGTCQRKMYYSIPYR